MAKSKFLEVKVGLFVLLALICLSFFVVSVTDMSFFKKGQQYQFVFHFANGLKKASPVRFAGVDAGMVQSIVVKQVDESGQPLVYVDVWMEQSVNIPEDSQIFINQLGLLGEKYIEIMPGVSSRFYAAGEPIPGEDPVAMESISKMVYQLAQKFDTTIDSVNEGVLSQENQNDFREALQGVNALVKNINDGQGTISKLLTDPTVHDNLEELTADLKANPWKLFYKPKNR